MGPGVDANKQILEVNKGETGVGSFLRVKIYFQLTYITDSPINGSGIIQCLDLIEETNKGLVTCPAKTVFWHQNYCLEERIISKDNEGLKSSHLNKLKYEYFSTKF